MRQQVRLARLSVGGTFVRLGSARANRSSSHKAHRQAQMLRQTRLQSLGMGALTVRQVAAVPAPEQSNEPCPGVGCTQDGGGGRSTQPPPASEYADPAGQTPASGDVAMMHP